VIIRHEERKHSGGVRASLHNHRVYDVRNEARAALLAYAFLRGKPFPEPNPNTKHGNYALAMRRAEKIAEKFRREPIELIRARWPEWAGSLARSKQPDFNPVTVGSNPTPPTITARS
jgi:hypothetical protein